MKLQGIVQYPVDAQSNSFFCALASALLPALGYAEDTPYFCAPKGRRCVSCGECGEKTALQKHHLALYHALLAASGVAFGFSYPEDDTVEEHSLPGVEKGWRWPDAFVDFLMGVAGLSWRRLRREEGAQAVCASVCGALEAGFPVPVRLGGEGPYGPDTAWQVAIGYEGGALLGLDSYAHTLQNSSARYAADGSFVLEDWPERLLDAIVITGRAPLRATYGEVLARAAAVLDNPANGRLEREILRRIEAVPPETAQDTACMLIGIASVPIEARWHAAEAFCTRENLLWRLEGSEAVKRELGEALFARYIRNNSGETHGVCWKIWGLLGVGVETGFGPAADSGERLLQKSVQRELKALFSAVFQNDREVLAAFMRALGAGG